MSATERRAQSDERRQKYGAEQQGEEGTDRGMIERV